MPYDVRVCSLLWERILRLNSLTNYTGGIKSAVPRQTHRSTEVGFEKIFRLRAYEED